MYGKNKALSLLLAVVFITTVIFTANVFSTAAAPFANINHIDTETPDVPPSQQYLPCPVPAWGSPVFAAWIGACSARYGYNSCINTYITSQYICWRLGYR